MKKYIRELRMGAPKTWKTGAVVGSYPKPLLYFGFDAGGIDIIPLIRTPIDYPYDCTQEDVEKIKPGDLKVTVPSKKITMMDYTLVMPRLLEESITPTKSQDGMQKFIKDYNQISGKTELPWKTIVFDSATGYADMSLNWISSFNPNAMADARQWAAQVGMKLRQLILSASALPAHVVFIFHVETLENELTKQVREVPMVYSKLRDDIAGLFSQVFYATKSPMNKPVLWTNDKLLVKGIGPRWPAGLPQECEPTFNAVYGKEQLE